MTDLQALSDAIRALPDHVHMNNDRTWSSYLDRQKVLALVDGVLVASPSPDTDRDALTRLIQRIERHVDFECGADHRYAFMEDVRLIAGDLRPSPDTDAGLDVDALHQAFLNTDTDWRGDLDAVAAEYARLTSEKGQPE